MTKKILILDDEENLREMLIEMVQDLPDVDIVGCGDGGSAMAELLKGGINLLITDNLHPGMSGCDIIDRLRQDPKRSGIKILMVSMMPNGSAETTGADIYIQKPFDPEEFQSAVRSLLGIGTSGK
jgi:CheY-like chemotaxis protein